MKVVESFNIYRSILWDMWKVLFFYEQFEYLSKNLVFLFLNERLAILKFSSEFFIKRFYWTIKYRSFFERKCRTAFLNELSIILCLLSGEITFGLEGVAFFLKQWSAILVPVYFIDINSLFFEKLRLNIIPYQKLNNS